MDGRGCDSGDLGSRSRWSFSPRSQTQEEEDLLKKKKHIKRRTSHRFKKKKTDTRMYASVVPTFRRSGFRRIAQPFRPPWGVGTPGTRYVLRRKGDYDVRIQDASHLTTGRASIQSTRLPQPRQRRQQRRRQRGGSLCHRVARRAYVHRLPQLMDRGINRALWGLRKKLTPTTLTRKLAGAAALGGAAAAAPLGFLGAALVQALCSSNETKKKKKN